MKKTYQKPQTTSQHTLPAPSLMAFSVTGDNGIGSGGDVGGDPDDPEPDVKPRDPWKETLW